MFFYFFQQWQRQRNAATSATPAMAAGCEHISLEANVISSCYYRLTISPASSIPPPPSASGARPSAGKTIHSFNASYLRTSLYLCSWHHRAIFLFFSSARPRIPGLLPAVPLVWTVLQSMRRRSRNTYFTSSYFSTCRFFATNIVWRVCVLENTSKHWQWENLLTKKKIKFHSHIFANNIWWKSFFGLSCKEP